MSSSSLRPSRRCCQQNVGHAILPSEAQTSESQMGSGRGYTPDEGVPSWSSIHGFIVDSCKPCLSIAVLVTSLVLPIMDVRQKQRCVVEFLNAEGVAPIDIHRRLANVYGAEAVDVSTVRRWVRRFEGGDTDVYDKPRSGRPSTANNDENEERLDQLIRQNRRITIAEMRAELDVGVRALEAMLSSLGYSKVCARWVPRMLTQENKENRLSVSRDLLNQYEDERDSFLDRIVTGDETWCHHYEPESKRQSMEWHHTGSPSKTKFKRLPSAGKVMCTIFWDRKGVVPLDFLESGTTINSDRYVETLTKLKDRIARKRPEKRRIIFFSMTTPGPTPASRQRNA